MASIIQLKDESGVNAYPLTSTSTVVGLNDALSAKQATLVSGTNIKTINNESMLGSGNITINADTSACELLANKVTSLSSSSTDTQYPSAKTVYDALESKGIYLLRGTDTNLGTDATLTSGTYAEAEAALNAGKLVILELTTSSSQRSRRYMLYSYGGSNNNINFQADVSGHKISYTLNSSNQFSNDSQRNYYESTTNKVTSISSSSTNTQYPGAKCVYDALNGKQDVIDSNNKLDYSLIENTPTIPSISGLEETANKVTSISASSTDTQYPSAKCVYDAINGAAEVFVATYGTTTLADITTAYNAGKLVYCVYSGAIYVLSKLTDSYCYLGSINRTSGQFLLNNGSSWSAGVSNMEIVANKVTSLSSSSTDTQYPSAKCVYDIVGDIETLINAL